MLNRDTKIQDYPEYELSPTEMNAFYFPAGSISSYQESIDYTEEEIEISLHKDKANEEISIQEYSSVLIPYEQESLQIAEKILNPDKFSPEFTVKNLKFSDTQDSIEEKYKTLIGDYNFLKQKFQNLQKSENLFQVKQTNTDIQGKEIDELQYKLMKFENENRSLREESTSHLKEIQELNKYIKVSKNEINEYKEKIEKYESEFMKLRLNIEDMIDEDGTSKTSRNHEYDGYSFITISHHLETIKKRLKMGSKQSEKINPEKELLINELSLQLRQKNSMIISLECKLNDLLKPIVLKEKDSDEEIYTERPRSTTLFDHDNNERITYRDVLRDLREITTRATKALKNSNIHKRAMNYCNIAASEKKKYINDRYQIVGNNERNKELENIKRKNLRKHE